MEKLCLEVKFKRIGIARALYNNPSILIFDESTNSLDSNTEREFMNILNHSKNKKIIIFVTHKLELLNNCDKIFQIKDNRLKQINTKNFTINIF